MARSLIASLLSMGMVSAAVVAFSPKFSPPTRSEPSATTLGGDYRHGRVVVVAGNSAKPRPLQSFNGSAELYEKYQHVVPMTVNILRQEYGERESWWGDLTASETRLLYWRLLPTVYLVEEEFAGLPLKDRAFISSMARYAAKLYARERSRVPERAAAAVYDGLRHTLRYGRWSWTGMSVEEIWAKYEREVTAELREATRVATLRSGHLRSRPDPRSPDELVGRGRQVPPGASGDQPSGPRKRRRWRRGGLESLRGTETTSGGGVEVVVLDENELYQRLYQRIITKSCSTNPLFDRIALGQHSQSLEEAVAKAAAKRICEGTREIRADENTTDSATVDAVFASTKPTPAGLLCKLRSKSKRHLFMSLLRTQRLRASIRKIVAMTNDAMLQLLEARGQDQDGAITADIDGSKMATRTEAEESQIASAQGHDKSNSK